MKPNEIKALALKKFPELKIGWCSVEEMVTRDKERRAYEQGLRAGIKLAKQGLNKH
jgi:hypothetical protein